MKAYSAAAARQHIAKVLDDAERGAEVIIERRGIRFRLVVEAPKKKASVQKPILEVLDPQLLEDGWSWELERAGGLVLSVGKSPEKMKKKKETPPVKRQRSR